MKSNYVLGIITLIAGFISAPISHAHHAVASEYGGTSDPTSEIKGQVVGVQWVSPHVKISIEATEGDYAGQTWDVLGHAPGLMGRGYGFLPNAINVGDTIDVIGWASKFGVPRMTPRAIGINGGPLHSTLSAADRKEEKEGTLRNDIIPAPSVEE